MSGTQKETPEQGEGKVRAHSRVPSLATRNSDVATSP